MSLNNTSGVARASLQGGNSGGSLQLFQADGRNGVSLLANGGQISTYGSDGQEQIRLWGPSYGEILLHNDALANQTAVQLSANGSQGGYLSLNDVNGVSRALLRGLNSGGVLTLSKSDGTVTVTLQADDGLGSGQITAQVLQITGGADLSEQFEVKPAGNVFEPSMVVCIDPERPGELVVSTRAYDRAAAGVLSEAGGVKPGMLMGQAGTVAHGKHPVALTGRVYCQAEASHDPGQVPATRRTLTVPPDRSAFFR